MWHGSAEKALHESMWHGFAESTLFKARDKYMRFQGQTAGHLVKELVEQPGYGISGSH
jgi:hypothetical protein